MAKTFKGEIKKNDIEGGIWELHTDDGKIYQLRGGDDTLRAEGMKVQIEGDIDKDAFGIGMTGPYIKVSSWKSC